MLRKILISTVALGFVACSSDDETTEEPITPSVSSESASIPGSDSMSIPGTDVDSPAASSFTPSGIAVDSPDTQAAVEDSQPAYGPAKNVSINKAPAAKSNSALYVQAAYLNVRHGPGMKYNIKRVIKHGDVVYSHGQKGIWVKIGPNEFVSKKYLHYNKAH